MEPESPSPSTPPVTPAASSSPAEPSSAPPPPSSATSDPQSSSSVPTGPVTCPRCHIEVRPTDFFCFNCGAQIQEKPVHVSAIDQAALYVASALLPPMGLFWGFRYYRKKGHQPKVVGLIAVIITLVSLVIVTIYTIKLMNQVTEQVNQRVSNLQSF